jgi:hypothetical protein
MRIILLLIVMLVGKDVSAQRRAGTTSLSVGIPSDQPRNLLDWHREADAILRIKITGQTAFESHEFDLSPEKYWIFTHHDVDVIDVFRGEPCITVGSGRSIIQIGGTIQRQDGPETQVWNGWSPLPVGTEWIVFLSWEPRRPGFMIMDGDRGTLQIKDGRIVAGNMQWWLGRQWVGKDVAEFATALRYSRGRSEQYRRK